MQRYDWVVDNLNTHWSLEVCRLVAQWCHVPYCPKALQHGVQRRAFLCDPTHPHVFHFTPKHGSWLNQVELWFSVLARRFLKRGDFASAHDFEMRLGDFMEIYNTHHAHPYRWTYTGQPLVRATPFSQTRRQRCQGRAWFSPRPPRFARAALSPQALQALRRITGSELMKWTSSCKGQITQETLNLIMFYHNHRRYKSGKRQGKAPIELLTGKPLEAPWWELLRRQLNTEQGVTDPGTLPTRPPLHLVPNNDGGTDHEALSLEQDILDLTGSSEHACQQKESKAA